MQYLLLCCFDEDRWDKLPETERERIMHEYGKFQHDLAASGQYRAGAKLGSIQTATTLRERSLAHVRTADLGPEASPIPVRAATIRCHTRTQPTRCVATPGSRGRYSTMPAGGGPAPSAGGESVERQ